MTWEMWFIVSIAGLMMLACLAIVVIVLRLCKGLIESLRPVLIRQLELVDKTTTLAASHDVMAYQGIEAMNAQVVGYDGDNYDPSDEAEARREAERQNLSMEDISAEDQQQLNDIFH